jgi:hypothetical protein
LGDYLEISLIQLSQRILVTSSTAKKFTAPRSSRYASVTDFFSDEQCELPAALRGKNSITGTLRSLHAWSQQGATLQFFLGTVALQDQHGTLQAPSYSVDSYGSAQHTKRDCVPARKPGVADLQRALSDLDCAPAAPSAATTTQKQHVTLHNGSAVNSSSSSAARRRRDSSSAQPKGSKRYACTVHNSALLIEDANVHVDALDAHMQSKGALNGSSNPVATVVSRGGYAAQAQARLALQQKAVTTAGNSRTQPQQPSAAASTDCDTNEEIARCYSRAQQQQLQRQQQLQQQQQQQPQSPQYDCYADDDSVQQQDDAEQYYEQQQQWERIPCRSQASTPRAVSPPPVRSHKLAQQAVQHAAQQSPKVYAAPAAVAAAGAAAAVAAAVHKAHALQQAAEQQQQQQQRCAAQGCAQYAEPQQQHSSDECEPQQQQPVQQQQQQQQQQQRRRRPRPHDSDSNSAWAAADGTKHRVSTLPVKPTREEINAKHVHTASDLLLFSRKARHVEYEPFTVAEWRKSKPRYAEHTILYSC